jgi:hypothetical protein
LSQNLSYRFYLNAFKRSQIQNILEQHLSSVPARPAGCSVRVFFEILPTPKRAQAKECIQEPQQRTKFKSNVKSISAKLAEQPYNLDAASI